MRLTLLGVEVRVGLLPQPGAQPPRHNDRLVGRLLVHGSIMAEAAGRPAAGLWLLGADARATSALVRQGAAQLQLALQQHSFVRGCRCGVGRAPVQQFAQQELDSRLNRLRDR